MNQQVLQLKITLNDVAPKVWRRIQVPEMYTFWDLHCAIQNAMGWMNCHLHGFYMTHNKYTRQRPTRIQMPHPEWDQEGDLEESTELLVDWFPQRLKRCIYTYDFGDTWDHAVLFERALPAKKKESYPRCVAGVNACPPEDCGGPFGYAELLTAIECADSPRGKELRAWLGLKTSDKYDPTSFHVDDVVFDNPKQLLKEYLHDQEIFG